MKKAILLVSIFCSYIASAQVEPLDTDGNGYRNISTLAHLRWISENDSSWSWNFELDNDIDAADTKNWNIGDHDSVPETPDVTMGWSPIGNPPVKFSGDFEGHGFNVDNLYSNRPKQNWIAFLGNISHSTISGLNIINCFIKGNNVTGSLVGWNIGSDIKKCNSTGNITGVECIGGLIGGTLMGSIDSCSSECSVIALIYVGGLVGVNQSITTYSHSTGIVKGGTCVGGLVGDSQNGIISYCYAEGSVSGTEKVGGLIGTNNYVTISYCWALGDVIGAKSIGGLIGRSRDSEIKECYSVGHVKGETAIGGLIGGDHSNTGKSCFWDKQSSGIDSSAGGIGKTTSEMKTKSTFTDAGWDFDNIWSIDGVTNQGYPFLQVPGVSVKDYTILNYFALSVSPNPASGQLNINYTLTEPGNTSISISNLLGIEMAKISVNQFQLPGSYNVNYDASNLPSGVYFITIKAGNKSETKKIGINY